MRQQELLRRVEIFASLEDRELDRLLEVTTTRRLRAKEALFHKGDPGNQLYGVLSGRLKVLSTSADGREVVFGLSGVGDVIGEVALIDLNDRSATVIALEASELLTLHRRDLLPFLERYPKVAIHIASVMARRVRDLSLHTEEAQFMPLASRLAKKVLRLSSVYGKEIEGGAVAIEIRLSQQDLADLVGTTRESVNKQLRSWEDQGVVELKRARITVRDPKALEDISELGFV
jgi:CRP/FNR family cyclic AMP-dependent transcriptional regulator